MSPMCLSVCGWVCGCVCVWVYLCAFVFLLLSKTCLSVFLSLLIHLAHCPSIGLSICLSFHLSVYASICLSIHHLAGPLSLPLPFLLIFSFHLSPCHLLHFLLLSQLSCLSWTRRSPQDTNRRYSCLSLCPPPPPTPPPSRVVCHTQPPHLPAMSSLIHN